MRKELILVLLGIICTSFISSFLSGYVQIESDKVLLDTVVGVVGAGNFSYWQLGHTGPLLVELISLSGDADLYVSENIRPSYEVERNNFSSVTCGQDLVNIPTDFPRPVGIGVFGYWSHYQSEYSIQVFLDAAAEQPLSRKMELTAGTEMTIASLLPSTEYKELEEMIQRHRREVATSPLGRAKKKPDHGSSSY